MTITPISQISRRPPEAGRIRLGEKVKTRGGGERPASIDTFRFTSPHKDAIEKLAEMYGGTVEPFADPKIAGSQWQVKTTTNKIEILVWPDGLSTWYELWSGGGCQRRCDGETAEVPGPNELQQVPCICQRKGQAECDPHTRLQVVLPNLDFYGMWRMQTKGWNAAHELPGMFEMVIGLAQAGRMVRAHLNLEQRKQVKNGQTRNFVVPTISVAATPDELLSGGGVARPQLDAASSPSPELGSGTYPAGSEPGGEWDTHSGEAVDDDVIEAVVIDEDREREIEERVRSIAQEHGHNPDVVVAKLWEMTSGDYDKLDSFIDKSTQGKKLAFTQTGNLTWRS